MKTSLGIAIIACSIFLFSFTNIFGIDDVAVAMRSGNATRLSAYLDYRVDISLPDKADSYSKSQAELIIRDFFNENVVKNFEVKQKGENSGSEFCFGTLQTRNGNFRTSIFMKQKGDRQYLQEIRFEVAQ